MGQPSSPDHLGQRSRRAPSGRWHFVVKEQRLTCGLPELEGVEFLAVFCKSVGVVGPRELCEATATGKRMVSQESLCAM
jgi:hypothetical protein